MKLLPLQPGEKTPIPGVSWKSLISDDPEQHKKWLSKGFNVGIPLRENEMVCADFDKIDPARKFWRENINRNIFNVAVRTRRGIHIYWSGYERTQKLYDGLGDEIGDLKGNGYCVWVGSKVKGHTYDFIPGYEYDEDIKSYNRDIFNGFPEERKEVQQLIEEPDTFKRIRRARAWLAKAEPAISGRHGHAKLFFCCCAMFQKFGLTLEQAYPLILEYNARSRPPFSNHDVIHKLNDAAKAQPTT